MVNPKKGGTAITKLPNSKSNNGTYKTAQDSTTIGTTQQAKTPMFNKTISSTNYTVSVHFSHTSNETFEDKILRMLESSVI